MKKHLSVFTLIAHHSIYKVMLLLLVMVGAEIGIFFRFVHRNPGTGFSLALELNHTFWIFSAVYFLVVSMPMLSNTSSAWWWPWWSWPQPQQHSSSWSWW